MPAAVAKEDVSVWEERRAELLLYNTLSRTKEAFTTVEPGVVRFYSCGPTVYDYAHIGNFRAFLTYDVIKRWLLCRGYDIKHVMNLTDIDDKIIRKVRELGCSLDELTNKYADAFFADLDLLNVIPAQQYPRATEHIKEIEETVGGLVKRGYAYERDGSTYFSVAKFESYGRLAQLEKREKGSRTAAAEATEGENIDSDDYDKADMRDFALWKSYKTNDAGIFWDSPLGKGRPGWHIECTCMAIKYLGPELDIHGGGIDLVFPHHENELAQSEALTGRPFSRFWVHNGFVNINNEKMSKSLGNFQTLRDIAKKPDDARAFRYLVVSSQYRSALAFTDQSLKSARSTVKRLDALRKRLESAGGDGGEEDIAEVIAKAKENFARGMDDDFNTPRAAAAMFSVVNAAEKMLKAKKMNEKAAGSCLKCLDDMDRVFGIFYNPVIPGTTSASASEPPAEAPLHLVKLLDERKTARKAKDFARADEIRDQVSAEGFAIVDTPQGPKLEPLES
ncbi:Cysteinyl-tRNA Synthetase [Chondrus crispus]|uniref:Cysteine--tRNA ligase n=1 Tax=Chondrus crispus TaxID=2769 RepID=R7QDF8_CHOCR|nr:Cysteinyl-tRNA Synthetase [Chondrus crispus]CDF35465.1 Cysteinyl-tRNA Synthetase [Chondrus crispus]|eukprot:XP_005715284.1 Cysteinyl-tRNA Synthetase [Chondrus crispus]